MVLEILVFLIDLMALTFIMGLLLLIQATAQTYLLAQSPEKPLPVIGHPIGLLVIVVFALLFHILNALSVPLYLGADSTTYLRGAIHLVQFHNFDAIWPYGPGMALLLAPVLAVFPRNPWAVKILLHLLAFACIPLSYRLGWQLTRQRGFAFFAALLTALTPDLFLYSNFVMSDLPNVFFELLFCTLLLSAMETVSWPWLLGTMLVGSFAVLLRAENAVLLMIGAIFLFIKILTDLRVQHASGQPQPSRFQGLPDSLLRLGLALVLAGLPILGWCIDNYRLYGFFGMSNDAGVVEYDAWIYYGEASHVHITDQNSPAVQTIASVYQAYQGEPVSRGPALGWHIYQALLQAGYSSSQAISIEGQAATDSLLNNPREALEILFIKIREGFQPSIQAGVTYHLAGEPAQTETVNSQFFDDDNIPNAVLIRTQRYLYVLLENYYETIYPVWIWVCIAAMFVCLLRRPFLSWLPIVGITGFRLFFPQIFGAAIWRYTISGIVLVQICALAVFESLLVYAMLLFKRDGTT